MVKTGNAKDVHLQHLVKEVDSGCLPENRGAAGKECSHVGKCEEAGRFQNIRSVEMAA